MTQQKCSKGHDGVILITIKVETSCDRCPDKVGCFPIYLRYTTFSNVIAVTLLHHQRGTKDTDAAEKRMLTNKVGGPWLVPYVCTILFFCRQSTLL